MQGLAYSNSLPVVPVSTLACLALTSVRRAQWKEGALVLPVLDARINEIYHGLYRVEDGSVVALSDDGVCAPAELAPRDGLGNTAVLATGSGLKYREEFPGAVAGSVMNSGAAKNKAVASAKGSAASAAK